MVLLGRYKVAVIKKRNIPVPTCFSSSLRGSRLALPTGRE